MLEKSITISGMEMWDPTHLLFFSIFLIETILSSDYLLQVSIEILTKGGKSPFDWDPKSLWKCANVHG